MIYKGSDAKIILTLKKNAAPLVLAAGENIIVILSVNNEEQLRFSKTAMDGYQPITDGTDPGTFVLLLKRELNKNFPTGKLETEVLAKFNDAEFPEGFHTIGKKAIDDIVEAKTISV